MSDVETVEVIVKLSREAAAPDSLEREKLRVRAAQLGVRLAPLHPSTSDADLAAYAVARVDPGTADRLAEEFRRCDGVEGAYAKPQGAPPERRAQHVG